MNLIDGKQIARDIVDELTSKVSQIEGAKPCIAFIRVGEDPASVSYVRSKNQTAEKIGIRPLLFTFEDTVTQDALFAKIDELNADSAVNGILIQSPLPSQLDEQSAFNRIDPIKDVDGFHVVNAGRIVQEDPTGFVSCTPGWHHRNLPKRRHLARRKACCRFGSQLNRRENVFSPRNAERAACQCDGNGLSLQNAESEGNHPSSGCSRSGNWKT